MEKCTQRATAIGAQLQSQARDDTKLEPTYPSFARFEEGRERRVLEIGVGMGADHLEWARHRPRSLVTGSTSRTGARTHAKLVLHSPACQPGCACADAERLPFSATASSWSIPGACSIIVRHAGAPFSEVLRVLATRRHRTGDDLPSSVDRRARCCGRNTALLRDAHSDRLTDIYANHLESPGNEGVLRRRCASAVCRRSRRVTARPFLSFADLLEGAAGDRAWWPDRCPGAAIVAAMGDSAVIPRSYGLYLLVEASK